MKVLVVGAGGREHALAWKISRDSSDPEIYCAPGNAGTATLGTNLEISATDTDDLCTWAKEQQPELVVVGPEAPLCAGLTDRLENLGIRVFGPSAEAAQLEGSKIFAKEIMQAAGVPTARARWFADVREAMAYTAEFDGPVVVKADGLAAGKGVAICADRRDAGQAITAAMEQRVFGAAGHRILIEECLMGQEASILALVDGEHVIMLASSQDHKRAHDGDTGPNTGGMGAYSPAPVIDDTAWPLIREQVFERTLQELRRRGITYRGVLYAGLMMTPEGPSVLEFNCRFGDPETQAVLPRWQGDILPALKACAAGQLSEDMMRWRPEACACVVMASGGYPGRYAKGKVIRGLEQAEAMENVHVFHAGTKTDQDRVVTSGGRVLGITALGADLRAAVDRTYEAVDTITFEKAFYRRDIAWRAL
jgi:phosphoribosylamine--glycine ligase